MQDYQYTDLLKKYGIKISMTETAILKDNAVAERVNNTIKNELFERHVVYLSVRGLRRLSGHIRAYNEERLHLALMV